VPDAEVPASFGDLAPLGCCGLGIVLGERGGYEGGDHARSALAGMRQRVLRMKWTRQSCQPVLTTLANSGLDAGVGVADDEFDAAQAAADELGQERRPKRLSLGRTDVHAEHLAPAVTVEHRPRQSPRRHDAPGPAQSRVVGVDP